MPEDHGWHRKVRRMILAELGELEGVYTSHDGKADIKFFKHVDEHLVELAEPDIVITQNNHMLVVEIENDDRPKHLFGVAFAVHSSLEGQQSDYKLDLSQKSLLIVLDSKKIGKKGSKKPHQVQEVKRVIESTLTDFQYFNITTEEHVMAEIKKWKSI